MPSTTRIDAETLRREYLSEGRSTRAIAARFGVTQNRIAALLNEYSIALRPARRSARRFREPEIRGFRNLATDWHAYWCGYLMPTRPYSDSLHRQRLHITLPVDEVSHLENFLIGLQSDVPVRFKALSGGANVASATIDSAELAAVLARWNIDADPRWWRDVRLPPRIPGARLGAYLRGYTDATLQRDKSSVTAACVLGALGSLGLAADALRRFERVGVPTLDAKRLRSGLVVVRICPGGRGLDRLVSALYEGATVWVPRQRGILEELAHPYRHR